MDKKIWYLNFQIRTICKLNVEKSQRAKCYVHHIGRTGGVPKRMERDIRFALHERNILRSIERLTQMKVGIMDHQYYSETAKMALEPPPPSAGHFLKIKGQGKRF